MVRQHPPLTADESIGGAFFKTASMGWVEMHGNTLPSNISIANTLDGGKNWSVLPFTALSSDLRSGYAGASEISFSDRMHGWILLRQMSSSASSIGALFFTSDGGQNWSPLPFPPTAGAIEFLSE